MGAARNYGPTEEEKIELERIEMEKRVKKEALEKLEKERKEDEEKKELERRKDEWVSLYSGLCTFFSW